MQVQIRNVRGHYEVYAADGSFLFSADIKLLMKITKKIIH